MEGMKKKKNMYVCIYFLSCPNRRKYEWKLKKATGKLF